MKYDKLTYTCLYPMMLIGQGASGKVFHNPNDDTVSKVFQDADVYENELEMLSAFGDCSCVISITHSTPKSITMPFMPYTLEDLIIGRQLSRGNKRDIIKQLCAFLVEAHEKGIIHNDFKAKNIMVGEDKQTVKVVDFDMAEWAKDNSGDIKKFRFILLQLYYDMPYNDVYENAWVLRAFLKNDAIEHLLESEDAYELKRLADSLL